MNGILVLDCGSQYTQIICRRLRDLGFFSEIKSILDDSASVIEYNPVAIILSGGPQSLESGPQLSTELINFIEEQKIPVLGICYGLYLVAKLLGGTACSNKEGKEYGKSSLKFLENENITENAENFLHAVNQLKCQNGETTVWMSHGDTIQSLGEDTLVLANCSASPAVIAHKTKALFGVQFHPEVSHTINGDKFLSAFIKTFLPHAIEKPWCLINHLEVLIEDIRNTVKGRGVLGALSGGVDSAVANAIVTKAIGKQLHPVFVNNGLLRDEDFSFIERVISPVIPHLVTLDRTDLFLDLLKGVTDPEQKRKIIGKTFIDVFDSYKQSHLEEYDIAFLLQGTLYPDVIESTSFRGPSSVIKSHHNVGGLPAHMNLSLIEPLRLLFKDEVRQLGTILGLGKEIIFRHPFPGPGLATRILGDVTEERLSRLRKADAIFLQAIRNWNGQDFYCSVSQAFAVLAPSLLSVGVQGDSRTYCETVILRSINTEDFMTATASILPMELLTHVSTDIVNRVSNVSRVVFDLSSKPPGTIEWQ